MKYTPQTNTNSKRLLTVKELSEYIGMPVATIYTKKCRGLLPKDSIVKFKGSSTLLFDKNIIDRVIEECKLFKQA